jgi:aspartyl/asparaginyl beta-hydroxylase (cupin superfamily)
MASFEIQRQLGEAEEKSEEGDTGTPPLSFPHTPLEEGGCCGCIEDDEEEEEFAELIKTASATTISPPRPVAPRYYDWKSTYPELQVLIDNIDVIRREALGISKETFVPWPEEHVGGERHSWTVFPFLHTFPAFDVSKLTWIDRTCGICPETVRVLRDVPNIRTALFSRIGPGVQLSPHTGWADLSNHVLRCHLCLKVPLGPHGEAVCGMEVEDEIRYHTENDILIFDDSKRHLAFNNSDTEDRVILIIDLMRPQDIPLGAAVGAHTPQLDDFISQFR